MFALAEKQGKKYSLNCRNSLKLYMLQRRDETPRRECGESRKKYIDCARLNPKRFIMGNRQPSSEQEKVQRLSDME